MILPLGRMTFPRQAKARVLGGMYSMDRSITQSRAEKAIQRLDELHVPKLIVLVVIVCNDCFNEVVC